VKNGRRYRPQDADVLRDGINEFCPLSFHSPYGISAVPEDQGWVAHFVIQALKGNAITVFGDGMQVRDLLYSEDLVEAFLLARDNAIRLSGRAFNMGGGPKNATSVLELLEHIGELNGSEPDVRFRRLTDWRPEVLRLRYSRFSVSHRLATARVR
jgi:CDP-paratose 2-epimerase